MANPNDLEEKVKDTHNYSVGVLTNQRDFVPIQSYSSYARLKQGFVRYYREWKNSSQKNEDIMPIAVEKLIQDQTWSDATCISLPKLMTKVITSKNI